MTTADTQATLDPIAEAYYSFAPMAKPPQERTEAELFWFRAGVEYMRRLTASKQARPISTLEQDPEQLLLAAFDRTRSMGRSHTRIEHFLLLVTEDPNHTLTVELQDQDGLNSFRTSLQNFLQASELDNPAGNLEPRATPELLRVFDRMVEGSTLKAAVLAEGTQVWARQLIERHLPNQKT